MTCDQALRQQLVIQQGVVSTYAFNTLVDYVQSNPRDCAKQGWDTVAIDTELEDLCGTKRLKQTGYIRTAAIPPTFTKSTGAMNIGPPYILTRHSQRDILGNILIH